MALNGSGARDFDIGGGFQHSGSYPMEFQLSGARDFDPGGAGRVSTLTLRGSYVVWRRLAG